MQITSRAAISKSASAVREMDKEEFSSLMDSMRVVGQLVPIYTHKGEIVDGRARLRACQRLKIDPVIEKLDPSLDPLDVVDALNIRRRHLSTSELAMAASRLGKRSPEDLAALGISKRSVEHADKVHRQGAPETIEAASQGEIPISLASRISGMPIEEQAESVEMVRQGKKSDVINRIKATEPAKEPEVVTPDDMVEMFGRTVDRIETIRRLVAELEDHERMIVETFLDDGKPSPSHHQESQPEQLTESEPIEVVQDRVTDEMIASPKMAGLSGRLQSLAMAVGVIRLLFAATEKHARRGDIGRLSDSAIAAACGHTGDAEVFVSALVQENWLQRDNEHRLLVVDWPSLCLPELVQELTESGEGFADPTGTPKIKEKQARKVPTKPKPTPSDAFERFWQAYPSLRKKSRIKAMEAWAKALKIVDPPDGMTAEDWLVKRAEDFAKSWKGKSKYACDPTAWLRGGCWDDAPEAWSEFREEKAKEADWKNDLRPAPRPLFAVGK